MSNMRRVSVPSHVFKCYIIHRYFTEDITRSLSFCYLYLRCTVHQIPIRSLLNRIPRATFALCQLCQSTFAFRSSPTDAATVYFEVDCQIAPAALVLPLFAYRCRITNSFVLNILSRLILMLK